MDGPALSQLSFNMARRHVFDPLEPTEEPRWGVVTNMHRAVLEARPLPLGADLKRVFVAAMLEWIDSGWQLSEFSSRSEAFFCTKDSERRMITILPTDHGAVRGLNSHAVP